MSQNDIVELIENEVTDRIVRLDRPPKKVFLGKSEWAQYMDHYPAERRVHIEGEPGESKHFQWTNDGSVEIVPTDAESELRYE